MRVAILGAGHWHVEMFYIPALQEAGAEIVGLHDPDPDTLAQRGEGLSCPRHTDHRKLLEDANPDLTFAHAPHAHMPALAADLISLGRPFHMEKPMGIKWTELDALAVKAQTEGVWTAAALVSRQYGMMRALGELKEAGELGVASYYCHTLIGGSPDRYREWGSAWMLDPALAGAGPLWNFGPHVVDLFLHLVDEDVAEVQCWTTHAVHGLEIEDLAVIRLMGRSGAIGIGQVGYVMPEGYERFFSLTTDRLHCGGADMGRGVILRRDGGEVPFDGPDPETVYGAHVRDTLERFAAGTPAQATIHDMARALRVMNAALTSARTGEAVVLRGS